MRQTMLKTRDKLHIDYCCASVDYDDGDLSVLFLLSSASTHIFENVSVFPFKILDVLQFMGARKQKLSIATRIL